MAATLVILGMHRSGTSLCSHWLSECGLHLGHRLMGGGIGNADGHFEDLDFHDLHEDIFHSNGISYGGISPTGDIHIGAYDKSKLELVVALKNDMKEFWGWKDPRTCLFIDEYDKVLRNPVYLCLFRPCVEVVSSLWNRKEKQNQVDRRVVQPGLSPEDELWQYNSIESWIQYNEKILEILQRLPRDQYRVASIEYLRKYDQQIIEWLNTVGFGLSPVLFADIYNPSQITQKDDTPIRYNEGQLARIKAIEDRFYNYIESRDSENELIYNSDLISKVNTELLVEASELRMRIVDLNKRKIELDREVTELDEKVVELSVENSELQAQLCDKNVIIQSAVEWQKCYSNRIFHKWRP